MIGIMVSPLYMYKHDARKGFTLIELLVVISIIAMLSSITLVSLKKARDKALDSKVKSQLRNLRLAAEVYKNNRSDGTYGAQVFASDAEDPANTIANGCRNGVFGDPGVALLVQASIYPSYVSDPITSPPDTDYARCIAITLGGSASTPTADRFMVVVRLSSGNYYCIDSLGKTIETNGTPGGLTRAVLGGSGSPGPNPGAALFLVDDCTELMSCGLPS